MSSANVEIVRAGIDAFNRRDFDTALENVHEDIEWHVYVSASAEVARGPEGVRRIWTETADIFGDFSVDIEEFAEIADYVIAVGQLRGRTPGDDTNEVTSPIAQRYRIRDGKLVEMRSFRTLAEATAGIAADGT